MNFQWLDSRADESTDTVRIEDRDPDLEFDSVESLSATFRLIITNIPIVKWSLHVQWSDTSHDLPFFSYFY